MGATSFVYASPVTLATSNLDGLANSAVSAWASSVVDNSSNLYLDAMVMLKLYMANSAVANSQTAFLYVYGGVSSGIYSNGVAVQNAITTVVTITDKPNRLKLLGSAPYTTQAETIQAGPFSVAQAFGGPLPPYWGIVLVNHTGAAVSVSNSNIEWVGVKVSTV